MEKKVQTMRAGWASDPVHPNGHIYAKMALNLIEKVAGASGPQAAATGVGNALGAPATGMKIPRQHPVNTARATISAAGIALTARGAGARAAAAALSTVATEGQGATPAAQRTAVRIGK